MTRPPLAALARRAAKRMVPPKMRAARASGVARLRSWRKQRQLLKSPGGAAGTAAAAYLKAHSFRHALDYPAQARRAHKAVRERWGQVVTEGPFVGMALGAEAFCSAYAPKVLGCYEAELHPSLDILMARSPRLIVNIGAAEGYYAVGLARRFPEADVVAFEIDERARELCADLARLNGVDSRLRIEGECSLDKLKGLPLEGGLIVCDCEGCEFDLLRPDAVPGLKKCDLLVEMHDCFDPRITPALRARFEATHDIAVIDSLARDPVEVAGVQFLPPRLRPIAVDDGRDQWLQWAMMTVKKEK